MNSQSKLLFALGGSFILLLILVGLAGYLLLADPENGNIGGETPPISPAELADSSGSGGQDFERMRRSNPELDLLLPINPEDGMPFVLTDASAHANEANKLLREKRFTQAIEEYRQASELDPRYETSLQKDSAVGKNIDRHGFETIKNRRVFPGDTLTYKQLYGW